MKIRPSRPLSVIGAMRDVQSLKIMKTQADLAPTLAEKAKIEWDWKQQDRPRSIRLGEATVQKAEMNVAEKKRKVFYEVKGNLANIVSDAWEETEELPPEEQQAAFTEFIKSRVDNLKGVGEEYRELFEDKDGNDVYDVAEISREDAEKYHGAFFKETEAGYKPGDMRVIKKFGGKEDISQVPHKPTKETTEKGFITLQDPADPENVITKRKGDFTIDDLLEKGWTEVKTPAVTINMPDNLTRTMKTKLQGQMDQHQQAIDRLDQIERLTKEEYLTFWGKGEAKLSEFLTKANLSTEDMKKYTADFGEFESATKVHTLLWRKLITGVAGGEKEMKAIEETTINVKDSYPRFMRKLKRQRIMARAGKQRAQYSIEHFGMLFGELTQIQKIDVQKRFPLIVPGELSDADELLKEMGYPTGE